MRLIAHRGLPGTIDGVGGNRLNEYHAAFRAGMDVEMDVRFHGCKVLCSHDPIEERLVDQYPSFVDFCASLSEFRDVRAFVNVKCDGMTSALRATASTFQVLDRIVTFDHSMPDFLHAENFHPDVPRATRASAYEWGMGVKTKPNRWVWLDPIGLAPEKMVSFLIRRAKAYHTINETSRIVVVSPDVHCRTPEQFDKVNLPGFAWEIARLPVYGILTDRPTMFGFKP